MCISTAIIPVAGKGTRFLPATKEIPKELLPILTRPMIDYVVQEAQMAQIERIVFITSYGKHQIADYYDRNSALEQFLFNRKKENELNKIKNPFEKIEFVTIRQGIPQGLGHAILKAKNIIGNEPFAVLLPDDLTDANPSVCAQMKEVFNPTEMKLLMGVMDVPIEETRHYGIVDGNLCKNHTQLIEMKGMVEKPEPKNAPSTWATPGRYLFSPMIFDFLEEISVGAGGEYQLTDAIHLMCEKYPKETYAHLFEGKRFDTGQIPGYLEATLHFAAKDPELKKIMTDFVQSL